MEPVNEKMFAHAARRARYHPAYVGWVFRRYQEVENCSDDDLARHLTVSLLDLQRLSFCLRPRPDRFAEDIEQLGEKFQINVTTLAGIIRLVEAVEIMGTEQTATASLETGVLLAARTRKKSRPRQEK
ncbi:MAG: hypothetical protein HYZ50_02370 [Deltaproteobacteria bacterium]|nr:hypothetical protein [Deltaproteobacteria bacterium]